MHELAFGFSLLPSLDLDAHVELVTAAGAGGLDLVGIQDHPYVPGYLDTFVLAGALLARTNTVTVFPDVANLPLPQPAMLAKTSAALDLVSKGRFELSLGAG
ncbi:alkanesulfonate monooxygenase SsuD/methylene tetrahydromethanopterin reductase-like flavin-dependent oxidoreductase (luciferase family) [Saccharomonospora amisosensis]|uniref:Alkanesulfonate monooxygenase SsuD/methylene tetrahydromethanopterin reductase-like flavin-dependent oxidoreductase (Luciferase family) n=1 Tax=Saccharomonospora amisosensis TaxID=1128677 RepID=A0A7X5ZR33_9PSEU|nr:LLM class flavin-dependent oxidoreductase [Saccharomonospora amisosensis]NIJ11920.1 alkanesulfonate monooxygenase SsuD/methylene tetrahydromethanopterin reductase-like flavin-dependent oxidoreductase (luciferase family) [Saccharomonospora amisosensis]